MSTSEELTLRQENARLRSQIDLVQKRLDAANLMIKALEASVLAEKAATANATLTGGQLEEELSMWRSGGMMTLSFPTDAIPRK